MGADIKNVILLSVDTLNRSALRVYDPDAPELPHLHALARESVRFTRAFSTASLDPSRSRLPCSPGSIPIVMVSSIPNAD